MIVTLETADINALLEHFLKSDSFELQVSKISPANGIELIVKLPKQPPFNPRICLFPQIASDKNLHINLKQLGFEKPYMPDAILKLLNFGSSLVNMDLTALIAKNSDGLIKRISASELSLDFQSLITTLSLPRNNTIAAVSLGSDQITLSLTIKQ